MEREIGVGGSGASRGRECMAVARAGWKGMSKRGRYIERMYDEEGGSKRGG